MSSRAMTASVIAMLFLVPGWFVAPVAQEIGEINRESVGVSLVAILANPAAYHGQQIRTIGVISVELGNSALFLSKEHRQSFIYTNAIWLYLDDFTEEEVAELNGEYVIVEGRLNAGASGHMGIFFASLEETNRIHALEHAVRHELE